MTTAKPTKKSVAHWAMRAMDTLAIDVQKKDSLERAKRYLEWAISDLQVLMTTKEGESKNE